MLVLPSLANASSMDEIYAGLKVENLRTSQSQAVAGDTMEFEFELVNRAPETLSVPSNFFYGSEHHVLGLAQAWVERLGPLKRIPYLYSGREGDLYARGGQVLALEWYGPVGGWQLADNLWPSGHSVPFRWTLETAGFPTGDYRYYVDYQQHWEEGAHLIQRVSVDFHVTGSYPVDLTPPTLTVPAEVVADASSPQGTHDASWQATATDDLDPDPEVSCSHESGWFVFPIGSTTVTCSSTDFSGNTATASFHVRIKDAEEQLTDLAARLSELGAYSLPGSLEASILTALRQHRDHRRAACNALASFDRVLTAVEPPPELRDELAARTWRIQGTLTCEQYQTGQ
jgi:hypothetical protein